MRILRRQLLHSFYFSIPAILIFAVFVYYPFLGSLYYSFTEWDAVNAPKFIGLQNYIHLFQDQLVRHSALNTLYICLFVTFIQNPLSLFLGIILNKAFRTRYYLRTVFYLPVVISLVVVSVSWSNLLQYEGVLNSILSILGLESITRDWLGSTDTALPSLLLIQFWYGTGYGAVIFLAGLQSIPHDLYESGEIDGARGWSKFRYITFPLLMPTVTICSFLGLVGALKFFDTPYMMTNGGPGDSTSTLALTIYNLAFRNNTFGYATAAGILFMIAISIVTALQLKLTRNREVEY